MQFVVSATLFALPTMVAQAAYALTAERVQIHSTHLYLAVSNARSAMLLVRQAAAAPVTPVATLARVVAPLMVGVPALVLHSTSSLPASTTIQIGRLTKTSAWSAIPSASSVAAPEAARSNAAMGAKTSPILTMTVLLHAWIVAVKTAFSRTCPLQTHAHHAQRCAPVDAATARLHLVSAVRV